MHNPGIVRQIPGSKRNKRSKRLNLFTVRLFFIQKTLIFFQLAVLDRPTFKVNSLDFLGLFYQYSLMQALLIPPMVKSGKPVLTTVGRRNGPEHARGQFSFFHGFYRFQSNSQRLEEIR